VIGEALARVLRGETLARGEMREVILAVMSEGASPVQVGGLLAALATRGETLDEVVGAAQAMRELATPLPAAPPGTIDTCGTGGDGARTFNLSTLGAVVAAGAGAPVAKHGNRAASSRCGSAELLEALGVRIDGPPARMASAVAKVGLAFLYARACHPAMARVASVRSALGVSTLFNRLGPLTHPMRVRRQLCGVARAELCEPQLRASVELGAERVWIVHGSDGLDELSPCAPTLVVAYEDGRDRRFTLEPGAVVPVVPREALAGGDATENAGIAREILAGERGPRRDAVVLQAAAALCVAERAGDLPEGARLAERALDSGAALDVLERLAVFSREEAA
jgi:anthranilate phosphoribosyltransferase